MKEIRGATAVITGGASGLGLAMAKALAAKGARLVLTDIDGAGAQAAAAGLRETGADAIGFRHDVSDEGDWVKAAEQAAAFGEVRILCSNAGVGGGAGKFEGYDTDVWRWNYAVNVHSQLYACRAFLGEMKAAGEPAHLVVTASMVAIVPPPISIAYISSKFATLGIALGLRAELADTQVGVSVLCPGMSATRIVETTRNLRPVSQEVGAAAQTSQAMGSVLASGMNPDRIGERVVQAIESDEFWILTHPEWKPMAEAQCADMLAGFGPSADPSYRGDDLEGLLAANNARRMNATVGS